MTANALNEEKQVGRNHALRYPRNFKASITWGSSNFLDSRVACRQA